MAADARPYKSKEQDGNGNEIILRDQQLVEQSSQTTMASTEYFEIVDVDGRMAKIPKDNMISVVREALGSLLNGLADQTTVAKFLTLNGNTLGASAAATAASVLGGRYCEYTNSSAQKWFRIGIKTSHLAAVEFAISNLDNTYIKKGTVFFSRYNGVKVSVTYEGDNYVSSKIVYDNEYAYIPLAAFCQIGVRVSTYVGDLPSFTMVDSTSATNQATIVG